MRFERLSKQELATNPEYVRVIRSLKVGDGAKTTTEREGVGKITIKQKLLAAADVVGVTIRFHRTGPTTVVFEVVGKS